MGSDQQPARQDFALALDYSHRQLEAFRAHISLLDTKASLVSAVNGLLLAATLIVLDDDGPVRAAAAWPLGMAAVLFGTSLGATLLLGTPRLRSGRHPVALSDSIVLGSVVTVNRFASTDEYRDRLAGMTEADALASNAMQIRGLAAIVIRRAAILRVAVGVSLAGLLLLLIGGGRSLLG